MKRWLLVLIGAAAAVLLMAAAPSRSDAGWSVGVGGSVYVGPGWYGPYYGPYPYYGPPYYDPYYDPYYGPRYSPPADYPDYGYLKTTIGPDSAEVWVDGSYYGPASDFDGNAGSLKLSPGEHQAQFRMPGYKTYTVSLTINPGGTTSVDYDLVPLGAGPIGEERREQ